MGGGRGRVEYGFSSEKAYKYNYHSDTNISCCNRHPYFCNGKQPKEGAEEYIIAMQKRDFDAIYELNYEAQKKYSLY